MSVLQKVKRHVGRRVLKFVRQFAMLFGLELKVSKIKSLDIETLKLQSIANPKAKLRAAEELVRQYPKHPKAHLELALVLHRMNGLCQFEKFDRYGQIQREWLKNTGLENLDIESSLKLKTKKLEIPVCCHESFSLDVKRLEKILNLSKDKILEKFLNKEYFCYMTGFIAGMPFLGDLDQNMRAQRLETPRVKVPKGSVGLTEQFANIYTFESPGGWNILGNTPVKVFDSSLEDEPTLINPGDTVTFKEISLDQYKNYNE